MEEMKDSLEGFLCPVCRTNFKTDRQLLAHYQDKHSDDLLKSVKDIYEKAKKKILSKDLINPSGDEEDNIGKKIPGYGRSEVNDEIGAFKNHTDYYKNVRTNKMEHYAAQTNNLIIRLEKLLVNLPSDPVKRKVHEQDIVPWLNEKDVKLCPGCAKSFTLLRRKHHCRLCGSVMCNECTFILPLDRARKMTNSLIETTSSSSSSSSGNSQNEFSTAKKLPVKALLRSPSGAAIQSVLALDLANETFFRVCEHCYKLLDVRQKIKDDSTQKPIICQFYEKMRGSVNEVNSQLPMYLKMFKSLSMGETIYNLSDAEMIRIKILKAAENIDMLSQKIAILGQNSESPPMENQLMLQKAINNAATYYLKEKIVSLPSLPKEEEIKEAQERRRLEIAKRIEEENRIESSLETVDHPVENKTNKSLPVTKSQGGNTSYGSKEVVVEDGWTPKVSQSAFGIISDHPIIQQINIIKGYIKQAESANRFEEVTTLQQNLRDLEEEFWRQTKENYLYKYFASLY
ncbi:Rabenosyn-5, putative [Pediculus humanus corporis]|uniref:Rabenosyn-5, putative n=1 Tax=Pediculus humanus subsp. corporis TaxID=121224 RepID=E0VZT9_PEDHC|nr:Rabenosyn-5, putative [Pediculus humanus corporis]EEB18895.1 Rabenosyn-5, putative [Pediculus humanus corporis]